MDGDLRDLQYIFKVNRCLSMQSSASDNSDFFLKLESELDV